MTQQPNAFLDVTIIVETYNLTEGAALHRLRRALDHAETLRRTRLGVQIMLADASDEDGPGALLLARLVLNYPKLRTIRVPGAGYEGIKIAAIRAAQTRYGVYLDGDCLPEDEKWIDRLLAPLHAGTAEVTCGTTTYEGNTLWAQLLSLMDFGFLLESTGGPVVCYASNNVAFVRQRWLQIAPPPGPLRSTCYAHARQLTQNNTSVVHIPAAVVRHEPPALVAERWRRGYDLVAVCWLDRHLREARWLRWGLLAAPLFYGQNLRQDWRRIGVGRRRFGWGPARCGQAIVLAALVRLVDLAGIAQALVLGPSRRWNAYGAAPMRTISGEKAPVPALEKGPNRA